LEKGRIAEPSYPYSVENLRYFSKLEDEIYTFFQEYSQTLTSNDTGLFDKILKYVETNIELEKTFSLNTTVNCDY